eukprot:4915901-Prorocentrum_lima.AAC.1
MIKGPPFANLVKYANKLTAPMVALNMNVPITWRGMPRPTLFLITSGHRLSEAHRRFSSTAFTDLAWHVVQ